MKANFVLTKDTVKLFIFRFNKMLDIIEPQLNIILTTDEDDDRSVYISGNFNNWITQDKNYEMERVGQGLYHFKFVSDFKYPDELLYKFTRGDWSEVEIDKYGNRTENRSCKQHAQA